MGGFAVSPRLESRGWCTGEGSNEGRSSEVGPSWRRSSLDGRQFEWRFMAGASRRQHSRRRTVDWTVQAASDESLSSPVRSASQPRLRFFGVGPRPACIVLYYWTGWKQPMLHHSLCGGPWETISLSKVASSSKWFMDSMDVDMNNCNGRGVWMEFVVTDGSDTWDKPASGGNYVITAQGRYTLKHGKVETVHGQSVMVVSDLDGTMVGDDAATRAFQEHWEQDAVVRGSVLVYNTGRNLPSFLSLLAEKSGVLPCPDILISSVGTKIYQNKNGSWEEDQAWSSQLDKGWRLDVVREATYSALAEVGKDAMHFRPPDEQNDHKVTCGVRADVLTTVLNHIESIITANNVKAKLITSGEGDWRFLDVVSNRAGKLESMDYVRRTQGFAWTNTVACGDSGNDILMLSGPNRAIVVGNAQPDLKQWVAQQKNGRDSSRLWMSSKHEALGILEGLEHFGFN